jgi:hypothetical protein
VSFLIKSFSSAIGAGFLHLIRSATGPFCRQFVQQVPGFSVAGQRLQPPDFSERCPPFSLVNRLADRSGQRGDARFERVTFCS